MGLILSCQTCYTGNRAQRRFLKQYITDRFPFMKWLPCYSLQTACNDFIAGLTVGLMVVPQSIAYAQIANVHKQLGLYTSFMGCFVYALLGTSKDITIGPTAILSQIVASSIDEEHQVIIPLMTLMCGIVQFTLGFLELGAIVNFISLPIVTGFTSAAAISIAAGELKHLLGIPEKIGQNFLPCMEGTLKYIGHSSVWDVVIGFSCIVLVMALGYFKTRIQSWDDNDNRKSLKQTVARKFLWFITTGRNAVVIVVAALIGGILVSQNLGDKVVLVKNVKGGLPPIINPMAMTNYTFTDAMKYLDVYLVVVPLIGFLEAISIAQAFARESNYRIDASQELIALGISNVLGSFVNAYPATGSFSRTAVNSQSGVKTPAGGIITGIVVLLALAFLTPLFYYIPQAALAAIIITAVLHMVNVKILLQIWKLNSLELIPWLVCFAGTLFLGIKYGVLIAVVIHLIFPLYWLVCPRTSYSKRGDVGILELNSLITYPGIDGIKTILHQCEDSGKAEGCPVSVFVLDCGQMLEIDFTVIQGFSELVAEYRKKNIQLMFANLQDRVKQVLLRAEIPGIIVSPSVQAAMSTAHQGLLASVDVTSGVLDDRYSVNRAITSSNDDS